MKKNTSNLIYPLLPLRDIVMFPGMIAPLFVGREKSVRALEGAVNSNDKSSNSEKTIVLVTQKSASIEDPAIADLYDIGVTATIIQLLKLPDDTVKVLVEAGNRVKIKKIISENNFFQCQCEILEESDGNKVKTEALLRSIINSFSQYIKLETKVNPEILSSLNEIRNPGQVADIISSHINIKIEDKQKILETFNIDKRLNLILSFLESEIRVLNTEKKISGRVKKQMEETQKKYYLNEKLHAIQKELGETDEAKNELNELEKKINKVKLSKEAKAKALSELKKLRLMNSISAEASIIRSYLECMLDLPWGKKNKKVEIKLDKALQVLDKDHYGLEKVKERILEYLAVQQRVKNLKGPIICLVGPPGVGKTSLARSIAEATGRPFSKISLGGVRDESEIRGHRRTYIGAMPGKIIQSIRKTKESNSLILLDEIDKMGYDFRGDPASALLEVLDPEQNEKFVDHYLEVEYDLSGEMFITTANSLNIPRPLLDRMEIIRISGYTEEEKLQIAKKYLAPKIRKTHGLSDKEFDISDDAIIEIIRYYTREAGVRSLEREIAKIARKAVRKIVENTYKNIEITSKNIADYLGVKKFSYGEAEIDDAIGVTTGLAYTDAGGDLLSIETVSIPGKGNIKATGKLGDVMQESAQAAFSYFRSKSIDFGITPPEYQRKDIHIHVPEGATPKDGPSAGVAIFTSIVSLMTNIPVKKTVAMTGEITLRGRVLAIGGLKEKLLAALRGGIKTVLIPKENEKDLVELPSNITKSLDIIPISTAQEAIEIALVSKVKPVSWVELNNKNNQSSDEDNSGLITH